MSWLYQCFPYTHNSNEEHPLVHAAPGEMVDCERHLQAGMLLSPPSQVLFNVLLFSAILKNQPNIPSAWTPEEGLGQQPPGATMHCSDRSSPQSLSQPCPVQANTRTRLRAGVRLSPAVERPQGGQLAPCCSVHQGWTPPSWLILKSQDLKAGFSQTSDFLSHLFQL